MAVSPVLLINDFVIFIILDLFKKTLFSSLLVEENIPPFSFFDSFSSFITPFSPKAFASTIFALGLIGAWFINT